VGRSIRVCHQWEKSALKEEVWEVLAEEYADGGGVFTGFFFSLSSVYVSWRAIMKDHSGATKTPFLLKALTFAEIQSAKKSNWFNPSFPLIQPYTLTPFECDTSQFFIRLEEPKNESEQHSRPNLGNAVPPVPQAAPSPSIAALIQMFQGFIDSNSSKKN
jgi:hypothetical protein